MQRRATIAVALTLGLSAETAAQTRAMMQPGPDTPRLLVAVFHGDRAAGVQVADALRNRVTSAVSVRTLYVVPKEQIVSFLESSGYRADSSLGAADVRELGRQLRADEIASGFVAREGTGLKVDARIAMAADPRMAQPLPTAQAANANDAARLIERSLQDARKQLPDVKACQNAIRSREHAKAIAAANAGIAKYPNAVIARLCLANALVDMKAPPDSILRVVNEIKRLDPQSSMARNFAYAALSEKGDGENAVKELVELLRLEPGNQTLTTQIIAELGRLQKPLVAIPIIDTLLIQSPGDPQLLRQRWQFTTLAAAQADSTTRKERFAEALTAGESMVRGDTAFADSAYYERQIIASFGADNNAKAVEFASRATQKFPRVASFWEYKARAERRSGQLEQAMASMQQAYALNPKTEGANVFIALVNIELGRPDSAVAIARRAVNAGEDKRTWGTFMLQPARDAVTLGQKTDSLHYYEKGLALAQEADRLNPQAISKFLIGVASFQVGSDALTRASEAGKAKRPDRPLLCTLGKTAQDMFLLVQTNMPAGGSVEPNIARQILGYVNQTSDGVGQMVQSNCSARSGARGNRSR